MKIFPSLECNHHSLVNGDTYKGHSPLTAHDGISLGALATNPYIIGTHFECHQQSPSAACGTQLVMISYASVTFS